MLLSLEAASLATVFAGSFGVALAGLLSDRPVSGRRFLDAALTTPLVLPPSVGGAPASPAGRCSR